MNTFYADRQKGKTTWLIAEAARHLTLTSGDIYLMSGLGARATEDLHRKLFQYMDAGTVIKRRVKAVSRGEVFITGIARHCPIFIDEADALTFRETLKLNLHDHDCLWITAK